jgi:GT2 family glycosyltransferase
MIGGTKILAVVVLYKMGLGESRCLASLRKVLSEEELAATIELMVCDNSPYEQMVPVDFIGSFHRDTTNPGLASWYNLALNHAEKSGIPWILLLDQDATVTAEYIREVVARTMEMEERHEIAAFVPKLIQDGAVCSPLTPPTYRHPRPFDKSFSGVATVRLHVFNSGSVLRVSAVKDAGGFPEDFPLDYLDHATFAALQSKGGKLFVLRATLDHELSSSNVRKTDPGYIERHRSILLAERRFYSRYGSVKDRMYRRVRLLRGALGVLIKEGAVAWSFRMMRAALE